MITVVANGYRCCWDKLVTELEREAEQTVNVEVRLSYEGPGHHAKNCSGTRT